MKHEFLYKDEVISVSIERRNEKWVAVVQDKRYELDMAEPSGNSVSILSNGHSVLFHINKNDNDIVVFSEGESFSFQLPARDDDMTAGSINTKETKLHISSPMPGMVLKIPVNEGDAVEDGHLLAIVEAMKMETELCSTLKGKVRKIYVKEGQQVDAGELIIELEEEK